MPEWWGLHVKGELVEVIRWGKASRPTLSDFNTTILGEVEYEIAPLHVGAA